MKKTAIISPCGRYRYRLTRGEGRLMPVVMLNPSTADADVDDPTIRRLLGFAAGIYTDSKKPVRCEWEGIDVVNLYALRATDPTELRRAKDPYGPQQREHLDEFCRQYGGEIIVAWGNNAEPAVVRLFTSRLQKHLRADILISCFGTNKNGWPRHPLYLPKTTLLTPYQWWK